MGGVKLGAERMRGNAVKAGYLWVGLGGERKGEGCGGWC